MKFKKLVINISRGLKYTIFATNLIAILLLVLSTKAQTIAPSENILFAYLGMGFPILLFINIAYLVLWIISFQWKFIIVQLIAFVFCIDAITTYIPINKRTNYIPENALKIMTYNVRGFNWLTGKEARENPILEYIANSGADIICMQEFAVEKWQDREKIISLKEFDNIMKDYPYRSIIRLGDTDNSTIYGLACYSKYPIKKVARIPIESAFNGSAMYEIRVGKEEITVVSNHLESNRLTAEDKELYKELVLDKKREKFDEVAHNIQYHLDLAFKVRETQADIIAECIRQQRKHTKSMIICGDFNEPPISYAYEKVKGDFLDSYKVTGRGVGITYHENMFWFRIDYIMYTPNLKSYNCTIGHVKYSDHYPLWTYITL